MHTTRESTVPRILTVNGHTPSIDPEAFVADDVTIAGNVTVAAGASIWFGCVLRSELSHIVIGRDTNVQDLTVLHTDADRPTVLGDRVTVGHRAMLHGCVVEDDVLIGMGAVVLNGARIGAGALVAAGAVVREGMEIPSLSLAVGIPAKVLDRPVPEVPRDNVANYLELAAMYRDLQGD